MLNDQPQYEFTAIFYRIEAINDFHFGKKYNKAITPLLYFSFRMTEYAGKATEEAVSEFIVSTCQVLPKSCAVASDLLHAPVPSLRFDQYNNYWHSGSGAEFYIRPVNVCVNDVDELNSNVNRMAFTTDFPVLPDYVHYLADSFQCVKIEPSLRYPGFVRLRNLGEMNYNWIHKRFEFSPTRHPSAFVDLKMAAQLIATDLLHKSVGLFGTLSGRGPAITNESGLPSPPFYYVPRVWCLEWPKEAQDWLRRRRDFGWPTIDTISDVVRQGCHVVYVQHRNCRHDTEQWRLSFSLAEVILLQSWTQIQQIVYHLLRFFAKRELILKDCPKENEVLCTYHLKTLMLWTCEEMSPEWWKSSSVISICCELLKRLSEWLERGLCPNYFIPGANLFHESSSPSLIDETKRRLNEFRSSGILCGWFLKHYILSFIHTLHEDENTIEVMPHILDLAINYRPLLAWRKTRQSTALDIMLSFGLTWSNLYFCCLIKNKTKTPPRTFYKYMFHRRKLFLLSNIFMSIIPIPEKVWCFTFFDKTLFSLNAV